MSNAHGFLLRRTLPHYWRTNLAVIAGVAAAVAVLAGALLVGESVRGSLRELALGRLGRTETAVTSARMFRDQLAADLAAAGGTAVPMIALEGFAIHQKNRRRAGRVQVYGVDERFWRFHGRSAAKPPEGRELLMSGALERELNAARGDGIILRMEKPSDVPSESLHGRKEDASHAVAFTVGETLAAADLGEFALRPQQGAVRAAFVSLARLQRELDAQGRANAVLLAGPSNALRAVYKLEDIGVRVRELPGHDAVAIESDAAILSDEISDAAMLAARNAGARPLPVFTYLANTIRARTREVPYSLVAAVDFKTYGWPADSTTAPPIVLNDWAARDLGARIGESVTLEYYVWSPSGLETRSADFRVARIVPLAGAAADPDLAPKYPGISDSPDLDDWDPPFPLELKRIRPRDEDYWDRYRTTPKAFIPIETGQRLWASRWGKLTSLRMAPAPSDIAAELQRVLDPTRFGLTVEPLREQALAASQGATDFGEYFIYFSFFLMASAVLLTGLFFKLGIEQRLREIGTLRAVGFSDARLRTLFLSEGVLLALAGSVLGIAAAIAYGAFIMLGLRTWWVDAVGTDLLRLHPSARALLSGAAGGMLAALAAILWTLRSLRKFSARSLISGTVETGAARSFGRRARATAALCGILAAGLLAAARTEAVPQAAGFFGAGVLLLSAFVLLVRVRLARGPRRPLLGGAAAVSRLGLRNTGYRPAQSTLCIALIASATFILVAVDAFRRDAQEATRDPKSGTGGYPIIAESLLPLYYDPNSTQGREALNLSGISPPRRVELAPFRLRSGDDASCLNLYRPTNPRILGVPAEFIRAGRFSFRSSLAASDAERQNPWLLLESGVSGSAIPAVADANSLQYVLHRKIGEVIEIKTATGPVVRLRIVAALADSVFQRELLISETEFLRAFPEQEGYRVFLAGAPAPETQQVTTALEEALSDYGFDAMSTAEMLAGFHRVENTYLSTFQALGGLGLLLGTLGLGAVLLRNVLARRRELALLRAVGYRPAHLALMVIAENVLLLVTGIAAGTAAAFIAIAPAFLERGGRLPAASLALLLLAVVITGLAASLLAAVAAFRSPLLSALRSE